jgi:hypothetical protein
MRDAYIYIYRRLSIVLELIEICTISVMASIFRLPPLIEEENDEVYLFVNNKFSRLNQTKKSLKSIKKNILLANRRRKIILIDFIFLLNLFFSSTKISNRSIST